MIFDTRSAAIKAKFKSFTGRDPNPDEFQYICDATPGSFIEVGLETGRAPFYVPPLSPEVDPNGIDAHAPGAKLDAGKVDLTHLQDVSLALRAVCEVFMFGEKKYTRGSWQAVDDGYERYTKAMLRHYFTHEVVDKDSGLLHDAHLAWNALARLELLLREGAKDGA